MRRAGRRLRTIPWARNYGENRLTGGKKKATHAPNQIYEPELDQYETIRKGTSWQGKRARLSPASVGERLGQHE